jgi:hypothetical protein
MRLGVQTLLIAVAGLSAIAIAVSGCTGDSDAEAESPPATTTGQVETQPPPQSAVNISKFRAAFEEAFGERPWYGQITGMKMTQITTTKKTYRTLEITTTLDPESETDVGTICEAVFKVADDAGVRDGIEAVRVIGSDGADGGCA